MKNLIIVVLSLLIFTSGTTFGEGFSFSYYDAGFANPPVDLSYPWMSPAVDLNTDGLADVSVYAHDATNGYGAYIYYGQSNGQFKPGEFHGDGPKWPFRTRAPYFSNILGTPFVDGAVADPYLYDLFARIFTNDGSGSFTKNGAAFEGVILPLGYGKSINFVKQQGGGQLRSYAPSLETWGSNVPSSLSKTDVPITNYIPWPSGVGYGAGWEDATFRHAYPVDLSHPNANGRVNDLVVLFEGKNPSTGLFVHYSWILERNDNETGKVTFKNVTAARGLPTGEGRTLFPLRSYDDKRLDLVDLKEGGCYRNRGDGTFELSGRLFTGKDPWGTGDGEVLARDIDGDGKQDILIRSEHYANEKGLFRNLGNCSFQDLTGAGLPIAFDRRMGALADFFGHGVPDSVVMNSSTKALTAYKNNSSFKAVNLIFIGVKGGPLGSKVTAMDGATRALLDYQQIFAQNRLSLNNNAYNVPISVRDAASVVLQIEFPNGAMKRYRNVVPGSTIQVSPY